MIARMWRGSVRTEKAAEYVEIVERTGIEGYRRTPGNRGAQILTRDVGDGRTDLITLSWWSSIDDIRAFAGDDVEKAKYYPEDDADETEIPFTARYGILEAPHVVELVFTEPAEAVTITLHELADTGTQLTYHNHGSPPAGRGDAITAAEVMIDGLAKSLRDRPR